MRSEVSSHCNIHHKTWILEGTGLSLHSLHSLSGYHIIDVCVYVSNMPYICLYVYMRMIICPKVVGNILILQTLVTDAPREIGTTCLCSAACGYQRAASQLPCWRGACRKLSTLAHLPCIHVLDCPLFPRTTPETTCLTPGSSGLLYKAPSGRLEFFKDFG